MSVSGELGDVDLAGLLQLLARNRATGRLRVAAGGDDASLYLDQGQLATVASARLALRLGRVLRQRGLVTEHQLHQALRQQEAEGGTRPLGELLVARGWLGADAVAACAEEQCVAVLARLLAAGEGTFSYAPGLRTPARAVSSPLDAQAALLEALRRVDELGKLRALLPSPGAPLAASELVDVTLAPFNEAEARILGALQVGAGSWGELVDLLPVDEPALLRALIGLRERGLVVAGLGRIGVPGAPPPEEADVARLLGT